MVLYSTNGRQTFNFLKQLDVGADYPSIAVGPGLNGNQGSLWVTWQSGTGNNMYIKAAGASVTGLGNIGTFNTEVVTGSNGMKLARSPVGPLGQLIVSFQTPGVNNPPANTKTTVYVNVDDDGLGPFGFRNIAWPVMTNNNIVLNTNTISILAQPNYGIT